MGKKWVQCDCDAIHSEVIDRVRDLMPDAADFGALSGLYKMFADGTRIKILWALSKHEMCVCDLAVLLDMTKSTVSHQLQRLRDSFLVKYDKRGKSIYYSLADEHVHDIFQIAFEHIKE